MNTSRTQQTTHQQLFSCNPKLNNWLILLLLGLATLSASLAFDAKASAVLLLDSEKVHAPIANHAEYYEDKTQQLSLNDIRSPLYQNRFTPYEQRFFRFGFTNSIYWIRFTLSNPTQKPLKIFLQYENITQADITAYFFSGHSPAINGLMESTTDTQENLFFIDSANSSNSGSGDTPDSTHTSHHYLPITLNAFSQTTYYLKASSRNPLNFSLYVNSESHIVDHKYSADFAFGIAAGLFGGLILLNFLAFLQSRQLVFLYYGLFLLTTAGYLLSISRIIEQFIPRLSHYQDDFGELSVFLAIALNIMFTQKLLDTKSISPLLDQRLQILLVCTLFATLIPLSDTSSFSLRIGGILAVISMLMMAYAAVKVYKQTLQARYYLLARGLTLTLTFIAILSVYGIIPLPFTITSTLLLAIIVDASIITYSLSILHKSTVKLAQSRKIHTDIEAAETHAKTEVLARVSHDIRTPMSGVLGMAELLTDTPLTPKQAQYVETIKSSGQSLLNVINNIMDYSKFESDNVSLLTVDFKLSELIDDCLNFFREKLEEKQIELIINLSPEIPDTVHGARERLRQILINLITNGIKFINKGNLIIAIKPEEFINQKYINFDISSHDIALSNSLANEIRDLLSQKSPSLNRPYTELEMNLIIASQLIHKMGGKVNFKPLRKGVSFSFNLILPEVKNQNEPQEQWAEKLKDLRLLVVDDNLACRQVIEQQAKSWGMITSSASNGMEALAMTRNNANLEEPFDIIVMDHSMPGMSGLELASRITEDPRIPHDCLCIMLTGLNIAPSDSMARKAGIQKVLTKPISGHTLKSSIAEELGFKEKIRRQQRQNLASAIAAKNLHILVAEDHFLSQKVIQSVLSKLNIQVTIVNNGDEAFKALQKRNFDIILMDCDMPTMNGFEATRKIRTWEHNNHKAETPIIALTAHIVEEYKEECLAAGMNDYISKPMDQSELESVIEKWAQGKNPPPSLSAVE